MSEKEQKLIQTNPQFSIIVPVYNVDLFLRECLHSIMKQSFIDYECLLIEDGSTDSSGAICDELCQSDNRFKCIHKTNGGLSDARNSGIKEACGRYVLFVDADDVISDDSLFLFNNAIEKYNSPDVVCMNMRTFGKSNVSFPFSDSEVLFTGSRNVRKSYFDRKWYEMAVNKAVKRDIIEKNRLYFCKGLKHEDTLWSFLLTMSINSLVLIPYVSYFYRIRECSIMQSLDNVDNVKYMHTVFGKMIDFVRSNTVYKAAEWYITDLIISFLIAGVIRGRGEHRYFLFRMIMSDLRRVNDIGFMASSYAFGIKMISLCSLLLNDKLAYRVMCRRFTPCEHGLTEQR